MKEVILCKFGEIALKGANRKQFENLLLRAVRYRFSHFGKFKIYSTQSTIYIDPQITDVPMDILFEEAKKIYGFSVVSRCVEVEKDMEKILKVVSDLAPTYLSDAKTFKIETKRSDKSFEKNSMEISMIAGGVVLDRMPQMRVDVHKPDVTIRIEIRDFYAYVTAGHERAAGGMPIGSNGKALLLLSGGIDSPVAGCMMAKRGVITEALHFESYPYTSERAKEKVISLAKKMARFCGDFKLHVISVTEIQEALRDNCEEDYFTILLRRFMMRLAEMTAKEYDCNALVTGESLGQVASQTMKALCTTDAVVSLPVFRPCIGMDKEEIITVSRKIDTFDISILPYEDCCTVFTPKHPRTKPEIYKVEAQEALLDDYNGLLARAFATLETIEIKNEIYPK
ncbi:MAG: tRNA 4-thiouridine(8) synthase ThiI [Clostridia bacterium]|nr:tRNA 4-thiouridine(8) synthase ThiI [Clostridia bacterium]